MVISMALVVVISLVAIMPLITHAMLVWGDNPRYSGSAPPPPPSNTGSSNSNGNPTTQTIKHSRTVTLTNTTTTVTITKTYTQVVTQTYVINHYIEYYLYPLLKWTFTLVNIGSQQAPGYHSVGNTKTFTPGYGGSNGIYVPVYAQEAIYSLNIAPSTKPVITGWYVGGTSESSSPPSLASQSVNTYLSSIQESVNTTMHQYNVTLTNTTTIINNVFMYWNNKTIPLPGNNNTQYVWIKPYFYSKQDIITAFTDSGVSFGLGYQYAMKAGQDLLSGNWGQAGKDLFTSSYLTGLGLYQAARGAEMVAWNYLIAYPTLAWEYIVSDPNTPWSIAHALGVTGTMASFGAGTAVSALEAGGSYIANWFSHL